MTGLPAPVEVTFRTSDVPLKALLAHVGRGVAAGRRTRSAAGLTGGVLLGALLSVWAALMGSGIVLLGLFAGMLGTLIWLMSMNGRRYAGVVDAMVASPSRSGPLSVTLNAQGVRISRLGMVWAIDWPLVVEVDQCADTLLIKPSSVEFIAVPFRNLPAGLPPATLLETIAIWRSAAKAPA